MTNSEKNEKVNKKDVGKTWLTGKHSCTLILPRAIADLYDLSEPSHVVIECKEEGILIRKLEV